MTEVAKDVGKVALTSAGTAASTSVGGTVGGAAGGALAERLVGDGDGDSKTAGSGAANVDEPAEALKKEFDAMTKGVQGEFRKELKQRDDRLDACEKTLADLHRALAAVKVQHLEVKRGSIWSLKVGEEKEGDWQTF